MGNTVVGFTIEIDGIKSINELNAEIKKTQDAMKGLDTATEEYQRQAEKLGKLKAEQTAIRKNQQDLNKSFLETSGALGAYDKLSNKLNRLRKELKDLEASGQGASAGAKSLQKEVSTLDKKLKDIDKNVGQFQRSVGNYPRLFGVSSKALGQFVPGLEQLSEGLDKATGGSNVLGKAFIGAFIAFKAGQAIAKAIGVLDDLVKAIDETRNAISGLTSAGGEELDSFTTQVTALASTFDVDAKSIAESAASLANKTGVSFQEALNTIENGLLSGQASNEDFLKGIEEFPEAYKSAGAAAGDYAEKQRELLNANKEFAASQVDAANKLGQLSSDFQVITVRGKAFLINVLLAILDFFKPVGDAFSSLGSAIAKLASNFSTAGTGGATFSKVMGVLLIPLKTTAFLIQKLVEFVVYLVNGFTNLIKSSSLLKSVFQEIYDFAAQVIDLFQNLPFVFAGAIAALKQMATNFANTLKIIAIDTELFGNRIRQFFGANVDAAIAELKNKRDAIKAESKTIGQAYSDGFTEAREEAAIKEAKEEAERARNTAIEAARARAKADQEAANERLKKQREQQKKEHDQLLKDREKFKQDEAKFLEQSAAVALSIQEKLNKALLDAIQDELSQQRASQQKASNDRINSVNEEFSKLLSLQKERLDEAKRLFGQNSSEVLDLTAKISAEKQKAEEYLSSTLILERIKLSESLLDIDKAFNEKAQQERNKAANKESASLLSDAQFKLNQIQRLRNEELITEEEAIEEVFKVMRARIEAEIALKEAQIEANKRLIAAGIIDARDENNALFSAKDDLYTQLSNLDANYTKTIKQGEEERLKAQKEANEKALDDFKKKFQLAAEISNQLLGVLDGAFEAGNEMRIKRIEQDEQANKTALDVLNERLQNSSGLERRFLEEQVEKNKKAADQIAADKEQAEKNRAKQVKARAIIEAIIATALAVVKSLPNIALSILSGGTGLAQTGIIAAQPLSKGGVVGSPADEIVQFANGGRVTNRGNITPLSNGDNVLATLTTGEIVLNKPQQKRVGYKALKAAGIPNFSDGGLVGAPTSLIGSSSNEAVIERIKLDAMLAQIEATNNRIDRFQVIWGPDTEFDSAKTKTEQKQINSKAQF